MKTNKDKTSPIRPAKKSGKTKPASPELRKMLLFHTIERVMADPPNKPPLDEICDWLINTINQLTGNRPQPSDPVDAVIDPDLLLPAVNSRWFPNGGGFSSIPAGETIITFAGDIQRYTPLSH